MQVAGGAPALTDPGARDIPDENVRTPPRHSWGPFLLAAAVVALDQVTKVWAVSALSDGPIRLIGDVLALRLTRNPGGAFSFFTGFTPVLAVVAIVLVVVIVRTTRRTSDLVMAYTLALVLGGALGNIVDRMVRSPGFLRGHVIDFIDLSFWPTFNLADSAISIGVLIVVVRGWR
ncbi:MAG: signal peptidase II, partial [Acidimicrobiia bacterium]